MIPKTENASLLIKNCTLLTSDFQLVHDQTIVVNDNRLIALGDTSALSAAYSAKVTVDAKGKLAMPGLIDSHTHTSQQLLRGRITDELPMIWTRIMVPYESRLQEKDVRISSQLSCLEMIKSGTTSFIDAGGQHMSQTAEAVLESGLRAVLSCSTMDSGPEIVSAMKQSIEENISRNRQLFNEYQGAGEGRLNVWFSLRSLLSCTPELIEKVFEAANDCATGMQAHMNEYTNEINYCLEHYQMRPYEYLDTLGVLNDHFLGAHSIFMSANEMDIVKERHCHIVHCPVSNSGKGVPNTPHLLQKGIPVSLGTDGAGHTGLSLFEQMRVFKSLMRASYGAPYGDPVIMPSSSLLKMATFGGAKAMLQDDQIGTLEVGKKADFILIDIDQPHIQPTHNLVNTLIEAVSAKDVTHSVVDGRLLMKDRQVLTMDEEKIMYDSKLAMESLFSHAIR
ncbi:amidohydrolase [Sporosarcina sp. NCCP-2716]|uniref:amidohydrolase family protein n=1 Tax=Sporosarcina sp. NCCP-2716 TaxID=2943679 RepID=UPI00203D05BA|nr:amidohydrolase [Sporosarcina sp. NCCP-2716]GKV69714.1 amidohydrolase [Sporosarcina sp. NCCP-2716]